jgi:hypothetical protein
MIATLPTRDPPAALREVQDHRKTGALELIPENAIHRGNERVRHALEFKSDVIDGELLGVEHVRFAAATVGMILGGRDSQREYEFRAEARTDGRDGNGRGGSPGVLKE